MKNVILASIININFVFIGRLLQKASTTNINTQKIQEIEERPYCYSSFYALRFWFLCLILYNSILIADSFDLLSIILYIVYWLPTVWWFNVFYNLDFKYAMFYSSFSGKFATVLAVWFEPHPMFWTPPCLFAFYCLYLSTWYKYCLPH